jgi:hypothetical protein
MPKHNVTIPTETHTMVKFNQDELPGFATVNSALKYFEPKSVFRWHLSVRIACSDLVKNRLPSPKEQDVLYDFEDRVNPLIKAYGNALFLARVTHNAHRELVWRVYEPDAAKAVLQGVLDAKDYAREFDFRMEDDPDWDKAGWYLRSLDS